MEKGEMTIGEKIAYYRRRKGLTQLKLAELAGVAYSMISEYEHNKVVPRMISLRKIADALEIDTSKFLPGSRTEDKYIEQIARQFQEALKDVSNVAELPILGNVHAGTPNIAEAEIVDVLKFPEVFAKGADYILRVKGMSMVEEGIFEGDLIFVKIQKDAENNDIVVARIEDEYTIKRFKRSAREVWLEPANHLYKSIKTPFVIEGVVTYVLRVLNRRRR